MGVKDSLSRLLPWQRKGYQVLEKYKVSDEAEGDRKVLAQLVAHGADLSRERNVVHYLYFPDALKRQTAELILQDLGYDTRHGNDYEGTKNLIAERDGVVDENAVAKERKLLKSVAERAGGEYDGWEAALD